MRGHNPRLGVLVEEMEKIRANAQGVFQKRLAERLKELLRAFKSIRKGWLRRPRCWRTAAISAKNWPG